MSDYINREEVMQAFADYVWNSNHSDFVPAPVWNHAVDIVRDFPAADVAPMRHGRWIEARGSWFTPGGDPVWECSECGKGMHVYGIEHGTYGSDVADGQWVACPNCGARMDVPDRNVGEMDGDGE